jgi:hypothetical protein
MSEAWEGIVNISRVPVREWKLAVPTPVLVPVPTLALNYLGTVGALGVEGGLGGLCGPVGEAK